jgi:hypothetical protein
MFQHVADSLAQAAVRLRLLAVDLILEPGMQSRHHRLAVLLVELEPLGRRQPLFLGQRFEMVDLPQGLEEMAHLRGEGLLHLDELPALHSAHRPGNIS